MKREVGDIAVIHEYNAPRGIRKLGRVSKTLQGADNKVRRIEIQYQNKGNHEFTTIQRSPQSVIVILNTE